jgi:tetratricopeptide (TPR) repeat protein
MDEAKEIACPRCDRAFQVSYLAVADLGQEPGLLRRILAESDPVAVCPSCQARILLQAELVVFSREVPFIVVVAQPGARSPADAVDEAMRLWSNSENPPPAPRPTVVTDRLGLRHAILRACGYAIELVSWIPLPERITLFHRFAERIDWNTLVTDVEVSFWQPLVEALVSGQRDQAATPGGVVHRLVLERLAGLLPDLARAEPQPPEERLALQVDLVRALVETDPDDWEAALPAHLASADPVAIEVCWENATAYRRQTGGVNAAIHFAQLGHWLASGFGTEFQSAESAYQVAAAYDVAGAVSQARAWYERALRGYLNALCPQQALECHKLLGDLALMQEQPAEAVPWYLDAIRLAGRWGLEKTQAGTAVNLARASLTLEDGARAESAALFALDLAEDSEIGFQVHVQAHHILCESKLAAGDRTSAAQHVRAALNALRRGCDWNMLSAMGVGLAGKAMEAGDWVLADEILTEALVHADAPAPAREAQRQPDHQGLVVRGDRSGERHRLYLLGGVAAWIARHDRTTALARLQTAAELARVAGDDAGLAEVLHHQGSILCFAGDIPASSDLHNEASSLSRDGEKLLSWTRQVGDEYLEVVRNGLTPTVQEPQSRGLTVSEQVSALNASLAFYARAVSLVAVDSLEARELAWRQSEAAGALAWVTRLESEDPARAVEIAQQALAYAERTGSDAAELMAREILYLCLRDAGDLQQAAETVYAIVERLVHVDSRWLLPDADEQALAGCRRWIQANSRLPGIRFGQPTDGRLTAWLGETEEAVIDWQGHALRLPGLAILSLREHGSELSIHVLELLSDSGVFISTPSRIRALGSLDPGALDWQFRFAKRQAAVSESVLYAIPERFLDGLVRKYCVLAGLSLLPAGDVAARQELGRNAYTGLATMYWALGMSRRALEHAPRPEGCAQQLPPVDAWVALSGAIVAEPQDWFPAVMAAFDLGEHSIFEGMVSAAIPLLEAREDWENLLAFYLARLNWLERAGRLEETVRQVATCRALLARVSEDYRARGELALSGFERHLGSDPQAAESLYLASRHQASVLLGNTDIAREVKALIALRVRPKRSGSSRSRNRQFRERWSSLAGSETGRCCVKCLTLRARSPIRLATRRARFVRRRRSGPCCSPCRSRTSGNRRACWAGSECIALPRQRPGTHSARALERTRPGMTSRRASPSSSGHSRSTASSARSATPRLIF